MSGLISLGWMNLSRARQSSIAVRKPMRPSSHLEQVPHGVHFLTLTTVFGGSTTKRNQSSGPAGPTAQSAAPPWRWLPDYSCNDVPQHRSDPGFRAQRDCCSSFNDSQPEVRIQLFIGGESTSGTAKEVHTTDWRIIVIEIDRFEGFWFVNGHSPCWADWANAQSCRLTGHGGHLP